MTSADPTQYIWWLVSRAAGIVALGLVSVSVIIGLAMAAGVLRRPGQKKRLLRIHEHTALLSLGAITVHGLALLGDHWLHPSLVNIAVPFTLGYRTGFTALGIIAAYLAALLGLSFYARRRIGARLWRRMHRMTIVVYVLGVVHTLGAGTDASSPILRMMMLVTGAPIVYLFLLRILSPKPAPKAPRPVVVAPPHRDPARVDLEGAVAAGRTRR